VRRLYVWTAGTHPIIGHTSARHYPPIPLTDGAPFFIRPHNHNLRKRWFPEVPILALLNTYTRQRRQESVTATNFAAAQRFPSYPRYWSRIDQICNNNNSILSHCRPPTVYITVTHDNVDNIQQHQQVATQTRHQTHFYTIQSELQQHFIYIAPLTKLSYSVDQQRSIYLSRTTTSTISNNNNTLQQRRVTPTTSTSRETRHRVHSTQQPIHNTIGTASLQLNCATHTAILLRRSTKVHIPVKTNVDKIPQQQHIATEPC
jgi:hypothetical protein